VAVRELRGRLAHEGRVTVVALALAAATVRSCGTSKIKSSRVGKGLAVSIGQDARVNPPHPRRVTRTHRVSLAG